MIRNKTILSAYLLACSVCCFSQTRTVTLEECLNLSHNYNPKVVNAGLDSKSAVATRKEARANWFPNVSVTATGFKAFDPLLNIGLKDVLGSSDAANNLRYYAETTAGLSGLPSTLSMLDVGYLATVNVMQPVFAGGRIANGNSLASLGVKAADVKRDIAVRENDDSITARYWKIVSLTEKMNALQSAIDLVRSLEKSVAPAVEAGLVNKRDLLQIQLKSKELQADMIRLRSGIKLAKMDLFNSVGYEYGVLGLDDIILSDSFQNLSSPDNYYQDENERADAMNEKKLLEMSVQAKKLEKKMALGEGLPEVGVGASMGYFKIVGDAQPNALVYAMVKIPISDWGKTAQKLHRAQNELEKAENDRQYLEKQLVLKANKDWVELQCAWEQILAAEDAVNLAVLMESQKASEYEAGLCTVTDLLKSQTELQAARSALVDRQSEYVTFLSAWKSLIP